MAAVISSGQGWVSQDAIGTWYQTSVTAPKTIASYTVPYPSVPVCSAVCSAQEPLWLGSPRTQSNELELRVHPAELNWCMD